MGMFLSTSGLPYSIHHILIDHSITVNDGMAFRPDKVVETVYGKSMLIELFCDEINNTSPLCLRPGKVFMTPTAKYLKTFVEGG
jgi:hypothetical protein